MIEKKYYFLKHSKFLFYRVNISKKYAWNYSKENKRLKKVIFQNYDVIDG